MTDSPEVDNADQSDDTDPRSSGGEATAGRARSRRNRRITASAIVLTVVGLLLANAVVVSRQEAEATPGSTLPLDGGNIHLREDGPRDAPAVVLIHGLAGSTHWWDPLVPMLARSHRVIRIDLLGHGSSAKPAGGGYAIPEQGRRVAEALDRLGVRRAVVGGHSTGGSVATALAEQRPDLVTALALVNTGPGPDAFVSDGFVGELLFVPVVGQLLWRARTDKIIRQGLGTAFGSPDYQVPAQLVQDVRGMTYHALTATSRAADEYLKQHSLPDRLAPLGKPLLVIFGREDRRWRSSSAEEYRTVPGAKVELLSEVGHSPMIEDPSRTAELLLAFTAIHPPRSG